MGKMPMPQAEEQVARILRDTCGVMVYEDDVMLVAAALMGCGLDQADRFRKAVQKCQDDAQRLDLSRRFLSACTARGVEVEFAKSMWVQMAKYNAYSFCRAHAASYAVLAYAGAYLKAHWPLEFWCSALVSYVFVELGWLPKDLNWSLVCPIQFSSGHPEPLPFRVDVSDDTLFH